MPTPVMDEAVLTLAEAAELLGKPARYLRREAEHGHWQGAGVCIGGVHWRFSRARLRAAMRRDQAVRA